MEIGFIVLIVGFFLFQQRKRIASLELSVKRLAEELVKVNRQLELLKRGWKPEDKVQQTASPVVAVPPAPATIDADAVFAKAEPLVLDFIPPVARVKIEESEVRGEPSLAHAATSRPAASAQPAARVEPVPENKLVAAVRRFFSEGNPIVRIGMVVMFFGVSFLVKYASGQGYFPIELRLAGVLLGAVALLAFGWKTRTRAGAYGLVLQGGGIAVIYLTLFAAAKIYGLIPLGVAFALLFLVVMLGTLLAVLQNAQVLAVLATAGGFLAPILTSTGEGSHIGLFSFYLILNIGILAIALHKAWRLLNWVGFMFTFVITAAWGVLQYDHTLYASTQPFLIAFFALYLLVSILFSFKQPANLKGVVDGSLVFGLPLMAFGLQTALLKHSEHGLAISALVLAAIYLLLSAGLRRYLQTHRVLIESFLALGISFATLAVPLALDASWTSVTWALEATGLIWVGLRQQRLRPRLVGYLLHMAAAVSLVLISGLHTGATPIITGDFIGLLLLSLTSFVIAYLLHRFVSESHRAEQALARLPIMLGVIWLFVAGIGELLAHIPLLHQFASILVFASLAAVVFLQVGKKIAWPELSRVVYALLPFTALVCLIEFVVGDALHPIQGFGLLAILGFFVLQYRFLWLEEVGVQEQISAAGKMLLRGWHIGSAWLLFLLVFWEAFWQQQILNLSGTASLILWFAALTLPVLVLMCIAKKACWPFVTFARDYKNLVPAPLFVLAAIWFFSVCHKTLAASEHYLPVLNALDLAQFAIVLLFAYGFKHDFMNQFGLLSRNARMGAIAAMLFIWINVVCLRAMSRYQDIAYDFTSLWDSVSVQMALSILWALCALLIMNLSRRTQRRELWMIGAALLGIVVLKLFTKDLTGSGTLARIVSFLVVGGLMLLIGLVSPIPIKPKAKGVLAESVDPQSGSSSQ